MNITRQDFAKLQISLILFVLLTTAGGALVYWFEMQHRAADRDLATVKARALAAEQKLRLASSEEAELKTKATQFLQLEKRRVIGLEARIDWVELISAVRAKRRLFEIDYELAPQQRLGSPTGGYQFVSSTMTLRMPLLHEGDLEVLLSDLKNEAPAIVQARKCLLTRMNQTGGAGANLNATCTLQWTTLNKSESGKPS